MEGERRKDQAHFMEVLEQQNKILEEQNKLLTKILGFITPIASFFSAFKTFVVFMAWMAGAFAAGYAVWNGLIVWAKQH